MSQSDQTLYERAGGEEGIRRLITDFYARIRGDEELAPFFEHTSMDKLQRMQLELFSEALGGPLTYSGRPLGEVHRGRGITKRHFARFVEHLLDTLKSLELTEQEVLDIISRLDLDADEITGGAGLDG